MKKFSQNVILIHWILTLMLSNPLLLALQHFSLSQIINLKSYENLASHGFTEKLYKKAYDFNHRMNCRISLNIALDNFV
jgi:hypothetical protein